jgi:hypothetical protein
MRVLTSKTVALLCAATLTLVACGSNTAPSDPGAITAGGTGTPTETLAAATAVTTSAAATSAAATAATTSVAASAAPATAATATAGTTSAAATPAAAIAGLTSSPGAQSPSPSLLVNAAPSDLLLSLADLPTGLFNPAVKCPPLPAPPSTVCALFYGGQASFLTAADSSLYVFVALRDPNDVGALEQRYCPGTSLVLPHAIGDSSVACSRSVAGSPGLTAYTILYRLANNAGQVELRTMGAPHPTYNFALTLLLADRQVAKIRGAR